MVENTKAVRSDTRDERERGRSEKEGKSEGVEEGENKEWFEEQEREK